MEMTFFGLRCRGGGFRVAVREAFVWLRWNIRVAVREAFVWLSWRHLCDCDGGIRGGYVADIRVAVMETFVLLSYDLEFEGICLSNCLFFTSYIDNSLFKQPDSYVCRKMFTQHLFLTVFKRYMTV